MVCFVAYVVESRGKPKDKEHPTNSILTVASHVVDFINHLVTDVITSTMVHMLIDCMMDHVDSTIGKLVDVEKESIEVIPSTKLGTIPVAKDYEIGLVISD